MNLVLIYLFDALVKAGLQLEIDPTKSNFVLIHHVTLSLLSNYSIV